MSQCPTDVSEAGDDRRHESLVSAGAALVAVSVVLTWVVAGTWVTLGLLGTLVGAALIWLASRRVSAGGTGQRPA